ncbi:hypothetical protein DOTSEDRAFT_55062 [Dothistroma septosporum NZE10]|uniref:Acyl-CoA dehydrogenase/oxidase N-terminal domain-containing protein n=1 Tax=Dothistroma septosporum (strain NZE10 / CBS 128990) TaxID=675120 RepID=N1PEV9_DOTSN|nr:hypothetical protein DOTSEDRAFT_55062 [Dothistroma septosporum NZE10]
MIDFTLSRSQQQIHSEAAGFADQVLKGAGEIHSKHVSRSERFKVIRQFYRMAIAGGMIEEQIPTAYWRRRLPADTSVALTIAATGLGLTPLILSGNETFQKEHLKPLLSGEGEPLASLMHSEPGVTTNWLERDGKGYGRRTAAARTGKKADLQCIVCYEIPHDQPNAKPQNANPRSFTIILLLTRSVTAHDPFISSSAALTFALTFAII